MTKAVGLIALLAVSASLAWAGCASDGGDGGSGGLGGSPTTSSSSNTSSTTSSTTGGGEFDYLELTINGEQLFVVQADDPACGAETYSEQTVDVSGYADGNTHILEFRAETFAARGGYSNFFVDSVSLIGCGGAGGAGSGGGSGCGEQIQDGSFEEGTPSEIWIEDSTEYGTPLCDDTCSAEQENLAHDGEWWAWFGGRPVEGEGSLIQHVTIPTDATTLTFQLRLHRCDDGS